MWRLKFSLPNSNILSKQKFVRLNCWYFSIYRVEKTLELDTVIYDVKLDDRESHKLRKLLTYEGDSIFQSEGATSLGN